MNYHSQRQHGFSIVEVLIAMVIALLGTIIIFQVFAVSEGIKRTSTSGGDAQQNGLLALVSIERSARLAGFGLNYVPIMGCRTQVHDEGPPVRDMTFTLAAAVITNGASNAPDSVTLTYGNAGSLRAPAQLTAQMLSTATLFKVDNRFGFNLGDVVLLADQGSTTDCTLRQITTTPANPAEDVGNDIGNYVDAGGNTVMARYNKAGGVGNLYSLWNKTSSTGGRVLELGPTPSVLIYSISANSQLMMQSFLTSGTAIAVADGIVQLQMEYGKDTNNDGNVDKWEATMPVTPTSADWASVLALRIALVARSSLAEKPDPATGICNTTTAQPTWSGTGGTLVINTDPNWMCYRYRTFETIVPLRNNIWKQDS